MAADDTGIAEIFDRMDGDNTGTLSRAEVVAFLKAYQLPATDADLLFEKMDVNHDGTISKAEFLDYARGRKNKMRQIFDEIDADKKGRIGKKDLRQALTNMGIEVDEQVIRDFVSLVDKSGDGKIDFVEFSQFLILMPSLKINFIFDHWIESRAITTDDFSVGEIGPTPVKLGQLELLVAGALAGAVSRTMTAPLDRLKTMFQAGPPPGQPPYTSIVDACKRVLKESSGWRAFFKGNGTNVLKIAPESGIKFWAFESLKTAIGGPDGITPLQRFVAGAIAGLTAQTLIYPMEVAKTRLAIATKGEYNGIFNCLSSVAKHEGPKALYKGLMPALFGIVPYAGVDLSVFSFLKEKYQATYPEQKPGVVTLLACGAISSTCGTLVAYPLVVVRTRLQAQGMSGRPVLYKGMVDCFKKTMEKEGPKGFYRGLIPNFMKAIPAISVSYVVYEQTKTAMESYYNRK